MHETDRRFLKNAVHRGKTSNLQTNCLTHQPSLAYLLLGELNDGPPPFWIFGKVWAMALPLGGDFCCETISYLGTQSQYTFFVSQLSFSQFFYEFPPFEKS